MKRFYSILPALALCLLALLVFWRSGKAPEGGSVDRDKTAIRSEPVRGLANEAPMGYRPPVVERKQADPLADLADVKLPKRADLSWQDPVAEEAFENFRRWTEGLPATSAGEGLKVGIELAQQRREALRTLIEKNPQRALELAVPHALRQRLPQEVAALLEQRVDGSGDLTVVATTLEGERGCQIDRKVTLQDGQVFGAFTYGRRSAMPTRDNIAIHGVALDGKLALSEFPGRVLEPSEVTARLKAGEVLQESLDAEDVTIQADPAKEVVLAFGDDRMTRYANETQAVAALLLAEGAEESGATAALANDLDGVIAYSPATEGQKTLLFIRVDFTDYQGGSATDSQLQTLISDMNSVYKDMSSNKASFALNGQGSAFTPVLRLPNTASYYNSLSRIIPAARTAATAAGYNYTDYTYEVVVTGAKPVMNGTAGVAWVGGRGAWLHNSQWNLKTCAHEVGHNFGLLHSGAWDTDDGSVIGSGSVWDYGNEFDIMGVGGGPHERRHFSASVKNYLDWVPDSDLVKITTNGTTTTRIRAMDKNQADGNKRALVVDQANSTKDYWIEHRQLYGTSFGMQNGVLVNWANINGSQQQPLLLDMAPSTSEKTDAILPLGKTFSDTAAAVHITPVARGTDTDGVNWVDVTVTRGAVTGNASPMASISATNANPAINGSVTFTCTASDPNGDTLAYFWDWGNGTTTATNNNVASKSWPTAGVYIVQCTVSDMKGLTTTADYFIQVGGTGFFIEGLVRTLQGDPLQGVVVTATPTTGSPITATSDAAGRYIITGLAAGTYTLTASSGIPDGFTNPLTIGPSLQDRNFTRQSYPLTWDGNTSTGGAQDGGGTWANVGGNWHNVGTGTNNVKWSNTTLDSATFGAGTDGTYAVTLSGTVQAGGGISFVNSGYTLSGAPLLLHDGVNNVSVSVAAGKTATINSAITYQNNKVANLTADSGATLNLGGGASNSQYRFQGAGTINMTSGIYTANVGRVNAANFNQSGGTFNMNLPSGNDGYYIGVAAGRSVNYTMSGSAIINANASGTANTNSFLAIGRGAGNTAYLNTLNVTGAANLNVGNATGMAGELLIAYDNVSNGALNVTGGAATVGTGKTDNKIYFFKAGSGFGYTASLTQSGGTVTANGIQFGGASGIYDAASTANLTLSGGVLYVGAQGITLGSAASDLPVAIKLEGGTLGASQNWSSSLDMQLGATGGGVTIRAQDAANTARNITLAGNLSDDSDVSGTLIKVGSGTLTLSGTGANTYTGATVVNVGTLDLGKVDAVSSSSSLTIANGAGLALSSSSSTVPNLTFNNTGTLSFDVASGRILTVNGTDGVTNSGAAGSITINITGAAPANGTYTLIDYSGTLQGSGFSAYTLGSAPLGKSYALANDTSSGAVQLVVSSFCKWTGAAGSEWSTAIIAGSKNWTKDSSTSDYANGLAVIFDDTASNKTVTITGTDVAPFSVAFNSGTYTLGGNYKIGGSAPVTVASGATLKLGSSNVLPDGAGAGNVTINGTLDLNGKSDTVNALTGSGSVDNTAVGTTSTLTVGANAGGTFSGTLRSTTGTLALTKNGATDVILTGSNSYNGATTINQGRLFISSGSNAFSPNTAVTVNNGASFFLNVTGTYAQSITLNSGANLAQRQAATLSNVILPSSGTAILNNDTLATTAFTITRPQTLGGSLNIQVGGSGTAATGAITLSGILSGPSGSLVKSGTGQLTLRGANTFGGGVTIKSGTLESATTQTTLGTGTVTMGGAGSTGATFITGQNNTNPFVINTPDSGSVVIGANGAGSGFVMSGGITLNGNLTVQTNENVISGSTKATAQFTGGVTGTGNLLLNNLGLAANVINISGTSVNHTGSITLQGTATGTTTISSVIGSNVTGITQSSTTSRLVLSGSNTYACNLTINAGTVQISNNSNTANDVSTVTIASGGTLNLTYAGTDTVKELFIGLDKQPAGVYGALGSVSPVIGIDQITGTGTLTVGAPEIAIEQPAETAIASGGSQDFGSVEVGSNTSLTFTIRNSGDLALNLTGTPSVAISGANAADFTVTADPTTPVAAGGTTTFTVRFTPSAAGARSASLSIASNDSDENPFVINLTGTGQTEFDAWSGGAAFDADANGDGVSNGMAFLLGAADTSVNACSLLPGVSRSGGNLVLTFSMRNAANRGTATLSVQHSGDLGVSDAWTTVLVPDASGGPTDGVTFNVVGGDPLNSVTVTISSTEAANGKLFGRLIATQ